MNMRYFFSVPLLASLAGILLLLYLMGVGGPIAAASSLVMAILALKIPGDKN